MVEIYLDGADLPTMAKYANDPVIKGFTTNPSLMRKAGITRYTDFARQVLDIADGKPVSFEVLSDDWDEMEDQAHIIEAWGKNVWVKIPITNTKGESSIRLIRNLVDVQLNITAVMTQDQLKSLRSVDNRDYIISVFCGRISDTGRYTPRMHGWDSKMLWASARQIYNLWQARDDGYNIITLSADLIAKLPLEGKPLDQYSLETVRQFHEDGKGIVF